LRGRFAVGLTIDYSLDSFKIANDKSVDNQRKYEAAKSDGDLFWVIVIVIVIVLVIIIVIVLLLALLFLLFCYCCLLLLLLF
jgi:Eukaryotic protein of unknown function (DUF846).